MTVITGADVLDEPAFYHESEGVVEIPVHGGLCRLEFRAGVSTGERGSDSCPGVGFDILFDTAHVHAYHRTGRHGIYSRGGGVIGRSGAKLLLKLLSDFCEKHP